MAENRYFQTALANFTADVAYAADVKHLYDLGYTVERIHRVLTYPVPQERIQQVIDEYRALKNSPEPEYEFVQDTDSFGRKSFRRVRVERDQK